MRKVGLGRERSWPAMKLYLNPQLILQSALEMEWAFISMANRGNGPEPYTPLIFPRGRWCDPFQRPSNLISCVIIFWSITTLSVSPFLPPQMPGSEQVTPLSKGINCGEAVLTAKGSFQKRTRRWSCSWGMGVLALKRAASRAPREPLQSHSTFLSPM